MHSQNIPLPGIVREFSHLFEHAPQGMILLAENGRNILALNPRAREMLGIPDGDSYGKDLGTFLVRDLNELTLFATAALNHGVAWTDTILWPGQGTEPLRVDATACGCEIDGQRFVLCVLTVQKAGAGDQDPQPPDTVEAALQDQAAYYRAKMARFERTALNETAHHIRTPLTPMLLQVTLLERSLGKLMGEKEKKALAIIRREIERLEAYVQKTANALVEKEQTESR